MHLNTIDHAKFTDTFNSISMLIHVSLYNAEIKNKSFYDLYWSKIVLLSLIRHDLHSQMTEINTDGVTKQILK
jgi:hypothetical protein